MKMLAIRPYAKQEHYWDVFFEAQEAVKNAFDANNIEAPVSHRIIINK
jgi:small conductance mechanosensitive channel